jgi:predicted DCC family thiol-disulfide oxidoreductase YuxK
MSRLIRDICNVVEPVAHSAAERAKINGWVLYDSDCPFCVRAARRFETLLARKNFAIMPLQTPWVGAKLGMEDSQLLQEMRLLLPDGTSYGGADALIEISRFYWWAQPVRQLAGFPAARKMLRRAYVWLAARRRCTGGSCEIQNATVGKEKLRFADFVPLFILPATALGFRNHVEAWVFMWLMAFALYLGCKWLTFRQVTRRRAATNLPREIGYLLAWPGMDAVTFLDTKSVPLKPRGIEGAMSTIKTIFGGFLLWGMTRMVFPAHPIMAGWVGMIGIVFILHFGLFHLSALVWQQAGVSAAPLMRNPILSRSLAEFWGRRWNTAFNELAFRLAFRPMRRMASPAVATLLVFGLSGLVHDLVISLPARGGYGLPTAYFLIQGAGLVVQRSKAGRRLGLDLGARGWFFTILVAAGPACLLFHPWFITNVILPMLARAGAI